MGKERVSAPKTLAERAQAYMDAAVEVPWSSGERERLAKCLVAFAAQELLPVARARALLHKVFRGSCPAASIDDVAYWRRFERALKLLDNIATTEGKTP